MALGQQQGVLLGGGGEVLAGGDHGVGGRGAVDVGGGTQHDVRAPGGGDVAVVGAGGGAQAGQRGLQRLLCRQLGRCGFAGQLRALGLRVGVQGLCQFGVGLQLRAGLAGVGGLRLGGGAARAGVGAQVQAAAGAQGGLGLRVQLQADATGRQALVAVLLQQVAHLQPALCLGGVQHHAALGGGVVHHQLVVGAAARLGRVQALRAQAAQGGGVGVAFQLAVACGAREPGRGVAGGRGGAGRHAVALGVGLTLAVVGRAEHHGAVDVAVEEGHDHLLAEARDEHAAPVGARPGLGHAHPGARGL